MYSWAVRMRAPALFALGLFSGNFVGAQTFTNPVFKGADPSVLLVGGMFYSVGSGCPDGQLGGSKGAICIRASSTLVGLGAAKPVTVWRAPLSGPNTAEVWAPDLKYFDGKWYIYYAADTGDNQHRLFALAPNVPGQVLGGWGAADTGLPAGRLPINWVSQWAIDPDVFIAADHRFYLTYSCRPTDDTTAPNNRLQGICLSGMSDPLHLTGKVVGLSTPTQPWEVRHYPTEEGPVGLVHNGITYIVYSASFSGSPDAYTEGILSNDMPPQPEGVGNPLLNPASWVKKGPIFDGHHFAYGTASVVLVPSADHTELWNVYHGVNCFSSCPQDLFGTWSNRSDRMQKAYWSVAGDLVLGYPVDIVTMDKQGTAVPLALPSTDGKGSSLLPAWGAAFGDAAEGDNVHGLQAGAWSFPAAAMPDRSTVVFDPASTSAAPPAPDAGTISSTSLDPRRYDQIFFESNPNLENYVVSTDVQLLGLGTDDPAPRYGVYGAYVDHNNFFLAMFDISVCPSPGCLTTDAMTDGADRGWKSCPLPAGFDARSVNDLTIEAVSGAYTLAVNGTLLSGSCQNRRFFLESEQIPIHGSNGQAGVVVEDAKAAYTHFNVSYGVPLDSDTAAQSLNRPYTLSTVQTYVFRNQATRMNLDNHCLGCKGAGSDNTQAIQYPAAAPYPLATSATQLWTLHSASGGSFSIKSPLSGKCLADTQAAGAPGALLQQVPCRNNGSQNWSFVPRGDGYYTIRNQATSRAIESGGADQLLPLRLGDLDNSSKQNWLLVIK